MDKNKIIVGQKYRIDNSIVVEIVDLGIRSLTMCIVKNEEGKIYEICARRLSEI